MEVRFFESASVLGKWFESHQARGEELWLGFYKKDSGKGGVTYRQALDAALCCGWIDGVRKTIDAVSYVIRFSPRRAKSIWSAVNIKRANELESQGRMKPSGLAAFRARTPERTDRYSYETRPRALPAAYQKKLKANRKAWTFFAAQPPSYRRMVAWWIVSAVREETRLRRLADLIALCESERRLGLAMGKKS
jgi:uncharacterized protein YdeI (YjbR/CyaY-like superfamily)